MIYFLYGDDIFRSRKKLSEIIAKFKATQGSDVNFQRFIAPDFAANEFLEAAQSIGFFSAKRLVVVENVMSEGTAELQEKIAGIVTQIPAEVLVVFWEAGKPEKSLLFPLLCQPKVAQEFSSLRGTELSNWIRAEAASLGCEIEPAAVAKLAEISLGDLWLISTELSKLSGLRQGTRITLGDINQSFKHSAQIKIFELTDACAQKNAKRAIAALHQLLDQGENEQKIISMLAYQLRNLAIIFDLSQRQYSQKQITTLTKMHPFVVKKITGVLPLFTLEELKESYQKLLELDWKIKSGKVEAVLGLEMFVIATTKK